MNKGIFVTGTDTGVGKTYVAAGIKRALREQGYKVSAMKPVVTGGLDDVRVLDAANVYSFKAPLAPVVAARLEKRTISVQKILTAYEKLRRENDFLVVEGIGGLLVPIKKNYLVLDLIKDMDIEAVIVARPNLGTINHTLLTVKQAQEAGIEVSGIIFNEAEKIRPGICERTNPAVIKDECALPILGRVKHGQANKKVFQQIVKKVFLIPQSAIRIPQYEAIDKAHIWHPFTQMQDWQRENPLIIKEAKGCYLKGTDGRWYLDGISSLWVNVHGHRNRYVDEAVKRQIDKVSHTTLLGLGSTASIELAKRLIDVAPEGLNKLFYSDNGSTAVEVGLKMAFQYWQQNNDGRGTKDEGRKYIGKTNFIYFENAYHGDTVGSVSVGGIDLFHKKYKPLLFKAIKAPINAKKLEYILSKQHKKIAAVIIEPIVQAAAGMLIQPPGFLKEVRRLCTRYGCLMIADEVATGFGRTGKMFACRHEGVSPDIMAVAKSITAGYLPLAATLATDEVYDAFCDDYGAQKTFFHGHTYTGNPLACAAAIANLDLFEKEKVLEKLQTKIEFLQKGLKRFKRLAHVGDIRQKGFMVGIELVKDKKKNTPYAWDEKIGIKVIMRARKQGVILRPLGNTIVIMPPLAISKKELQNLLDVTYNCIDSVTTPSPK